MPKQKTWTDLLGKDTSQHFVEGRLIVHRDPQDPNHIIVDWEFDTHHQAVQNFVAWKKELGQ